jgi:hypothetical protein
MYNPRRDAWLIRWWAPGLLEAGMKRPAIRRELIRRAEQVQAALDSGRSDTLIGGFSAFKIAAMLVGGWPLGVDAPNGEPLIVEGPPDLREASRVLQGFVDGLRDPWERGQRWTWYQRMRNVLDTHEAELRRGKRLPPPSRRKSRKS